MLEHDRIDMSEYTDVSKTNRSLERIICHYWYFLEILSSVAIQVVHQVASQTHNHILT